MHLFGDHKVMDESSRAGSIMIMGHASGESESLRPPGRSLGRASEPLFKSGFKFSAPMTPHHWPPCWLQEHIAAVQSGPPPPRPAYPPTRFRAPHLCQEMSHPPPWTQLFRWPANLCHLVRPSGSSWRSRVASDDHWHSKFQLSPGWHRWPGPAPAGTELNETTTDTDKK